MPCFLEVSFALSDSETFSNRTMHIHKYDWYEWGGAVMVAILAVLTFVYRILVEVVACHYFYKKLQPLPGPPKPPPGPPPYSLLGPSCDCEGSCSLFVCLLSRGVPRPCSLERRREHAERPKRKARDHRRSLAGV